MGPMHPPHCPLLPWGLGLVCSGGLPVQSREEAAGRQQGGTLGEAAAPLAHPLQVPLGEVSHADGPR